MSQLPPYSQLPSPSDPTLVEAAAQQITTAGLSNWGQIPNPQAAYESLLTQSVPSLVGAIQSQDPQFRSALASSPAGAAQTVTPAQVPPGLVQPPATYSFDPKAYAAAQPGLLKQSQNASWKSMGEVPALSMGYVNSVTGLQDPGKIKKWQTTLQKQGFYGGPVNGVMDQITRFAFESMMISRAIPTFLYSQDQNQQAAAGALIGQLGGDTRSIQSNAYHDPYYQHQYVTAWMSAQGPDQKFGDKAELDNYVSQFGAQNLPASWQSVYKASNDPLAFIGQGILNIPIIGGIEGMLNPAAAHAIGQGRADNLKAQLVAAEQQQAKATNLSLAQLKNLMAGDQQALANLTNQVQNGTGFMGWMDGYDRLRTQALLAVHFVMADAAVLSKNPAVALLADLAPLGGHLSADQSAAMAKDPHGSLNPFDPHGLVGQQIAAADGNLAAGMFGNDWTTKNPLLSTIYNVGMNMADDPISYIPGAAYGKAMTYAGSGSRALMKMSDGIAGISRGIVDQAFRVGKTPAMAQLVIAVKDHPSFMGVATVRDMLGGTAMGERGAAQLAAIKAALENKGLTEHDLVTLFSEHKFDHRIANVGGAVERQGYLKHLSQMFDTTSSNGLRASLARIGMTDHLGQFDFTSNLGAGISKMQDWAALAKLDPQETRALLDGMVGIPEEQKILAFGKFKDAIEKGIDTIAKQQNRTVEDVFNAITKRRRSLFGAQREGAGEMVSGFMADPKLGHELSWTDLHGEDPVLNRLNQQIKDTQDAILMKAGMIDGHDSLLTSSGMETGPDHAAAIDPEREMVELRKADLNRLIDQRNEYQRQAPAARRPSPAIAEQLRDNYAFPFSMNELATELNPNLRRIEMFQHKVGMNVLTQLWKPWVLANMGTALRITLGEDLIRPSWKLLFDGHPLVAAKLMGEGMGKALIAGTIPDKVRIPFTNIRPGAAVRAGVEKSVNTMGTQELIHSVMSRWMQTMDPEVFVKYAAGDINYDQALAGTINKWSQSTMIKPYLEHLKGEHTAESARQVLQDAITGSSDPGIAEVRRLHPNTDAHAALLHEFLQAHMEMPELRDMWLNGAADTAKIRELSHAHAHDGTQPMPIIFAPRNTLTAQHFVLKALNKYPQWMFDKKLSPMIAAARDTGFLAMKKRFADDLTEFYKGRADWNEQEIEDEAISLAFEWSQRNMYMGTRTMLGASLRNVFPFWGATANMSRFYMREALSHPFSGDATLRVAKMSEDQQQNHQQYAVGGNGFLAMLGFTGGDALSIDPYHSFFLTSDGINSFVPGQGPWLNLTTQFVPGHQQIAEALAGTPLGGGLNQSTGQAGPIIPWLGQLATGAADTAAGLMGDTGPVNLGPLGESVDTQKLQTDELVRQREEQGQTVDPSQEAGLLAEVGRKFFLEGALRWSTPVTPSVVNEPGIKLKNAMTAWSAAPNETAKDNLIAAELGVTAAAYQKAKENQTVPQLLANAGPQSPAVAMAFFDSNVTPEQRDIIGKEHPWVTAFGQSFYNAGVDPTTGKPQQAPNLAQFQQRVASGGITLDDANSYIQKIQAARDIQGGWLAVDQLNNAKYAFMRQNGLTTQSNLYKQWDAEVYQPAMQTIQNTYKSWNAQFGAGSGGGTTIAALSERTAPLRTLMSLEVIPQDPAFETVSTTLWRQALVWRDQAAQQIAAMQMGTHSTAEIQLVMDGLQSRLAWLAQQDPTFAQQLDSYNYGRWEDIVSLEADQLRNQELYGIAT